MKRLLLLVLFSGLVVSAQIIAINPYYGSQVSEQLKAFLELTSAQVTDINAIHADFGKLVESKTQRQSALYLEIAQETAKTPVDPMALGVRYAEIETIRRDIATEETGLYKKVLAKLTDAQKAKLTVLDQARKLQVEVSDAQCQHMLEPLTTANPYFSSTLLGTVSFASTSYCGIYGVLMKGLFPASENRPISLPQASR